MGCGASVGPQPLGQEDLNILCILAAKEMGLLCMKAVIETDKISSLSITAPGVVSDMRQDAKKIRDDAANAEDKLKEAASGVGGMLGSAMAGAAQLAAGGVGAAIGKILNGLASAIDAAVDKVDDSFKSVAQDIVSAKKNEFLDTFQKHIAGLVSSNALSLCRGESPWHGAAYEATKPDACSNALIVASAESLKEVLGPQVDDALDNHKATKAWADVIGKINEAIDKIGQYPKLESMKPQKIELNIKDYIITQIIAKVGQLMGQEEAALRLDSVGKSQALPETFPAVFSKRELTTADKKNAEAGK